MPNWVYNNITVKGKSKEEISDFIKKYFNENGEFDFNKVIPEPLTKEECPEDCLMKGNDGVEIFEDRPWFNWYTWRVEHWGTKWNSCESDKSVCDNGKTLYIYFDTAWTSPSPVIKELKAQNKHLKISGRSGKY